MHIKVIHSDSNTHLKESMLTPIVMHIKVIHCTYDSAEKSVTLHATYTAK